MFDFFEYGFLNHPIATPSPPHTHRLRVRLATVSYKCVCTKKFSLINLDVLELVIKKSELLGAFNSSWVIL